MLQINFHQLILIMFKLLKSYWKGKLNTCKENMVAGAV